VKSTYFPFSYPSTRPRYPRFSIVMRSSYLALASSVSYTRRISDNYVIRRRSTEFSGRIDHSMVFLCTESRKNQPSQEITACIIYQDPKCQRSHHPVVQFPSPLPSCCRQLRSWCIDEDEANKKGTSNGKESRDHPVKSVYTR